MSDSRRNSVDEEVTGELTDLRAVQAEEERTEREARAAEAQKMRKRLAELDLLYTDMRVATAESVNMGGIFLTFLTETGRAFLENAWHYFAFPVAAVFSVWRAVNAWKETKLKPGNTGILAKAGIEIFTAFAVTIAVLGGLIAQTFAAVAAPIIFTIALALKSLFHLGKACQHLYEAHKADKAAKAAEAMLANPKKILTNEDRADLARTAELGPKVAMQQRALAKANAIGFFAGLLTTIAVGFVMLAAKPGVAVLGVISAVIGTVTAVGEYRKAQQEKLFTERRMPKDEPKNDSDKPEMSVNAQMHRSLSQSSNTARRGSSSALSVDETDLLLAQPAGQPTLDLEDAATVASRPAAPTPAVAEEKQDEAASDKYTRFGFGMQSCSIL